MMKKLMLAALLFSLSFSGLAQEQSKSQKKDEKIDEMVLHFVKIQTGNINERLTSKALQQVSGTEKKAMKRDIRKVMDTYYKRIAKMYLQYYTKDEMKRILDFYRSDLGRKIKKLQPKLSQQTRKMNQKLMRKLDPIFREYLD